MPKLTNMTRDRAGVFLSHSSAEKSIALKLQKYLRERFGKDFPVFVSSDGDSIGGGEVWFNRIRQSLKRAKVVILLLSPWSKNEEWILFEAGVGDGAGHPVIPVVFGDLTFSNLGFPLQGFHGRELVDLDGIVSDICRKVGYDGRPPLPAVIPDFKSDIASIRLARIPRSSGSPWARLLLDTSELLSFTQSTARRLGIDVRAVEPVYSRMPPLPEEPHVVKVKTGDGRTLVVRTPRDLPKDVVEGLIAADLKQDLERDGENERTAPH
ncbi:MAG: toll/interleukin-1 receptor domain-containing protein [Acidobacteriales bacterium]|nr:toll/interleukin-1 receptor domain-containing protein [Terriglobales bacterium]